MVKVQLMSSDGQKSFHDKNAIKALTPAILLDNIDYLGD